MHRACSKLANVLTGKCYFNVKLGLILNLQTKYAAYMTHINLAVVSYLEYSGIFVHVNSLRKREKTIYNNNNLNMWMFCTLTLVKGSQHMKRSACIKVNFQVFYLNSWLSLFCHF